MVKRIQVSGNQRFLVTEQNEPFFWLGDTAWELFHRLTREETEHYLETRRAQGFSVIQAVILAEQNGLHDPNAYGQVPLLDADPTRPNEAYFEHVDYGIKLAEEKGLYIGLLPTWADKVTLAWGQGPVVFNQENAYSYGQFLGKRYRERSNILWILGGDRDGKGYENLWRAMAQGIETGLGAQPLMTYHPMGGQTSSSLFHHESWLSFNMQQSGHHRQDIPTWERIEADYALQPPKPVLDGEPNYEDHPINWQKDNGYFRAYDVRKQAYRAVFAGACGHTYGNQCIWQFYDHGRHPVAFPEFTWQEALLHEGAVQMRYVKDLLLSRPFLERVPDQGLLISAPGEGGEHVCATRAVDGSYAFIYIPAAEQTVEIAANKLSGETLRAWWYNPRTGLATETQTLSVGPVATFTTPAEGPDWVLVLDSSEHNFPVPGQDITL